MTDSPIFTARTFDGDTMQADAHGFTFTATVHHDSDADAPWVNEDGHGKVSDWVKAETWHGGARCPKSPGQLVLAETGNGANTQFRLYDLSDATRTALRDGWGVSPYRMDIEHGANGLMRATGQWFEGRDLHTFTSDWCDDINDAQRQAYAAHRATFPSARAYAAAAARADFDRLRAWANDDWNYVGVSVTVERAGVQLVPAYRCALWGIESDAGAYLVEVANDLASEAHEVACEKLDDLALVS